MYIRDMLFALSYAAENRRRMMEVFKDVVSEALPGIEFLEEINIHHNYAHEETHFGRKVWVHRKGATSAKLKEKGIIPGSMGTPSYIVEGLGNPESFMSCAHGAGRIMGRKEACRSLSLEECRRAMEGVVYDGFKRLSKRGGKDVMYDLEEAPLAYKNIEDVLAEELDLVRPLVKLRPIGVLKG
jgi:tRNA-splicing ligase RtcB